VGLASHWLCIKDSVRYQPMQAQWPKYEGRAYTPLRSMAPYLFYRTKSPKKSVFWKLFRESFFTISCYQKRVQRRTELLERHRLLKAMFSRDLLKLAVLVHQSLAPGGMSLVYHSGCSPSAAMGFQQDTHGSTGDRITRGYCSKLLYMLLKITKRSVVCVSLL